MMDENNTKGIFLVIISMALFSFQDALIKLIFERAALYEIYFGRTFIAAILFATYLYLVKQKIKFKTEYPFLTFIRVILHFVAFSAFFISLTYMSLAVANALFFSSPFFISIFAHFFLNERIGIRRWLAVFFGFIGIYVILNPDFKDFEYSINAPKIIKINPRYWYDDKFSFKINADKIALNNGVKESRGIVRLNSEILRAFIK